MLREIPPSDWLVLIWVSSGLVGLIALAEWLRRFFHWPAFLTRKLIHLVTGFFVFAIIVYLQSYLPVLVLTAGFVVVNGVALRFRWFPAMHRTGSSLGTVLYPLSFFILTLFGWQNHRLEVLIGMALLAFSDALAATVGKQWPRAPRFRPWGEQKSLPGSAAMFASAWAISLALLCWDPTGDAHPLPEFPTALAIGFCLAVFATAAEALSVRGSDNLSVPLLTSLLAFYLLHDPGGHLAQVLLALLLGGLVAVGSVKAGFLKPGGALAAFLLAVPLFGMGGLPWAVPILTFFVFSSLLSRLNANRKQTLQRLFEKGHRRDASQVLANGAVAGFLVLLSILLQDGRLYVLYLSAVAAATADTWATEIGIHARRPPRLITRLQPIPPGRSGGVSLTGLAGALLGACLIALVGLAFPHRQSLAALQHLQNLTLLLIVTTSGFLASLVDSLLGATLQSQYRCPECGRLTEKIIHCAGHPGSLVQGKHWINNDVVNFLATVSALFFALAFLSLVR